MKRSSKIRKRVRPHARSELQRIAEMLLSSCDSPAEVFELCYWSREAGLLDVIRGLLSMPEETRAAIEAFIALAQDPRSIVARLDGRGALTLASPEVAKTLALAHYVADREDDPGPQSLN